MDELELFDEGPHPAENSSQDDAVPVHREEQIDDWSWQPSKNPDIVVRHQPAIACYENVNGEIVIRQQCAWCDEEDALVIVQPNNLRELIRALANLLPSE